MTIAKDRSASQFVICVNTQANRSCTETVVADHILPKEGKTETVFHQSASECIADRIEALAMEMRAMGLGMSQATASLELLGALAATLSKTRRLIDEIFEFPGFAVSPGCDIMLELFQARVRGKPLNIKRLSAALPCEPTTSIRWIMALEKMRLLERIAGEDQAADYVAITERGFQKTAQALQMHLQK